MGSFFRNIARKLSREAKKDRAVDWRDNEEFRHHVLLALADVKPLLDLPGRRSFAIMCEVIMSKVQSLHPATLEDAKDSAFALAMDLKNDITMALARNDTNGVIAPVDANVFSGTVPKDLVADLFAEERAAPLPGADPGSSIIITDK